MCAAALATYAFDTTCMYGWPPIVCCSQVCGAARKVAEECGSTANRGKCVGFTYDGKCGMLKTSLEGAVAKGGSTVYIMGTPSIASGVLAPAAAAPATAKA
jgi:hypothetical protein